MSVSDKPRYQILVQRHRFPSSLFYSRARRRTGGHCLCAIDVGATARTRKKRMIRIKGEIVDNKLDETVFYQHNDIDAED